jgi:hypothetical protein
VALAKLPFLSDFQKQHDWIIAILAVLFTSFDNFFYTQGYFCGSFKSFCCYLMKFIVGIPVIFRVYEHKFSRAFE